MKHSVDEALATGRPAPCSVEMRGRTVHGGVVSYFWVEVNFCFSGTRFYSTWRDISATKKAEVREMLFAPAPCFSLLTRARCRCHPPQRCLHDFLNTTSHDARTPLTSIQVASQLLSQSESLTDDALDLVTAISASARVLLTIVHNVMLKKRLDSGECDVSSSPMDIRALLADVVATARVGLALQSGTSIVWEDEDAAALPALMHSSPEHLSHLLLNLTVFCVRASDGQPVHVAARCAPAPGGSASPGTQLVLEVAARGHIMPERAFEPYAQPDSSTAADAGQQARAHMRMLHPSSCMARACD